MSRAQHKGHRHRGRRPKKTSGPKREHISELHPTSEPPDIKSFEEWDLGPEVQRAIFGMDIHVPTPIQKLAIGPVLEGRDVIAKAETGTGKTLAFGAPLMSRIDPARSTVLALVLCPTRELAQQVADVLSALALPMGVRTALVVGGDPMHPQINALQAGAQVVIGTPGRVLDLYQQRFLSFPWTEFVVLDEADKMFEIGFLDDIKKILSFMPDERQTLLFSATFPTEVLKLARAESKDPVEVATAKGASTVESIDQFCMQVEEEDRPLMLTRLMEQSKPDDVFLVFCDRRTEVDRLLRRLERLPFGIKALHGGYDQASRFRVMSAFRTGDVKALIATDVASRGLDVQHVTHVVNYSVPRDVEDYTHRIGRTGRAGRSGTSITFVTHRDRGRWRDISRKFKWPFEEAPTPGHSRRHREERRPRRGDSERDDRRPRNRDERRGRDRGEREERPRARRDEREREPRRQAADDGHRRSRHRDGERERADERPRREQRARHSNEVARDDRPERGERRRRRDGDGERRPRRSRSSSGEERRGSTNGAERGGAETPAFGAITGSKPERSETREASRPPRRRKASPPEGDSARKPRRDAKNDPPSFGSGIG